MGLSIENRAPFLTIPLVEFAYALPEDHIISAAGSKKAVFRRAMRGLVPDEILDRRDKIGFATPAGSWLLALRPWVEQQLPMIRALPCMDRVEVDERWAAVQQRPNAAEAIRIWRWISLSLWAEQRAVRFD
jgi:asparagine synthase (glutamine-hydrolysing)